MPAVKEMLQIPGFRAAVHSEPDTLRSCVLHNEEASLEIFVMCYTMLAQHMYEAIKRRFGGIFKTVTHLSDFSGDWTGIARKTYAAMKEKLADTETGSAFKKATGLETYEDTATTWLQYFEKDIIKEMKKDAALFCCHVIPGILYFSDI